ncbi:threonylcarbamoyl-AMP synthase [Alicyclobacillus tolerans]|uniref:L-threonylcarbamoyladenylate synthase n=1 Tax=Alicyclobacillus tolerans TaxID=90970 RepID=UPI001F02F7CC|nr:L-threonylcarbamoyladenylate synthase [Alicyclobacillus tolerans]MCF8567139.1 threonylcarbamoyl-AMP synthase [Alicyclobacillus tolerans]
MKLWRVNRVDIEGDGPKDGGQGTQGTQGTAQLERSAEIQEAAEVLRQGGLIAFPTETVYGLGANALQEEAVRRIFAAKGRPGDNPLIVHIASLQQLTDVTDHPDRLPEPVQRAMRAFWPGPLTLILPASSKLAPSVHPGLDTVGIRFPSHPVAQALIRAAGCPVAAPSANRSGRPSPTTAQDVLEDMADRVDGVIDGGPSAVGVESTVALIERDRAVIYRPGGISKEQLEAAIGVPVELDAHLVSGDQAPKAPGMKYRHYAPDAKVYVWWGDADRVAQKMQEFALQCSGEPIAVISPTQVPDIPGLAASWTPQSHEYPAALARELYRLLREFDRLHVAHILIAGVAPDGIGLAVMNRLEKAAEGRVERV